MDYHKVQFTGDIEGVGYQLVESGVEIALRDEQGLPIDTERKVYEVVFIQPYAPMPEWGTP